MTCIVGLKTKQGVLLGADSALDFGTHTALCDDKLFKCAGVWCGAAGDAVANGHFQDTSTAEYTHEPNWTHGFTVLYHDIDTGMVQPYPVVIQSGRFIWDGKVFGV